MADIIKVIDHISDMQTHEDGSKIYHLIKQQLQKNQIAELSFSGINGVTSTFINTSIVMLLYDSSYDIDKLKKSLKITNTNSQINHMITFCLETALKKKPSDEK